MVSSNKGKALQSSEKVVTMKIRLVKDIDVKVYPSVETCRVKEDHYTPITEVALDRYISLYTMRVPNRKGDRLVYLSEYGDHYVFYVPRGEDIWSDETIMYKLTDIENDILGLADDFEDIVAKNIEDRFATYGYFVDADIIARFCETVIVPEYTLDEIKDMVLKKELNK